LKDGLRASHASGEAASGERRESVETTDGGEAGLSLEESKDDLDRMKRGSGELVRESPFLSEHRRKDAANERHLFLDDATT
jgi:hypothetical protein